jgi:hypothetical protein
MPAACRPTATRRDSWSERVHGPHSRHRVSAGARPAAHAFSATIARQRKEAGLSGPVVAGAAGRALEHLADELSKSLKVSVVRKEQEDYTIGDLWPPVRNLLRGSAFWDDQMEKLERAQFLRNKLGSHYAPWGDGISDSEVADAAQLVRHAWELLACDQCGKVVKVQRAGGRRQIVRGCTHGS